MKIFYNLYFIKNCFGLSEAQRKGIEFCLYLIKKKYSLLDRPRWRAGLNMLDRCFVNQTFG